MEGRDGMRAADADREATAERLRVALEEGRLDLHEYDERLQQTYGAKTYAELDTVLADLPGPASPQRSALAPVGPGTAPAVPPGPVHQDSAATPGREAVPGEPVGGGPTGAVPARWLVEVWGPWLRVAAFFTVIWAISAVGSRELLFYWPVWVLGPWGAMLLARTAGGFATGTPERDVARWDRRRAARAVRRRERREQRRHDR
ncbi:DUF1707 domain-containing protein [Micromonospora sp. NPDC051925]|uniref:DUF1707 domain-containing protein n=1 Tax=Micromonospora sp. NPDC051925 TaxID=3364288 RepID=UPI0037C54731